MAATAGAFDGLPSENIKAAQSALLSSLEQKRSKLMAELDKGDKPSEIMSKTIVTLAQQIAKQYEPKKKA